MLKNYVNWDNLNEYSLNEMFPNMETLTVCGSKGVVSRVLQLENSKIAIVSYNDADMLENPKNTLIEAVNNGMLFEDKQECFLFLRNTRQDNAEYFEHKKIADPLIRAFYKDDLVDFTEVV